MPKKNFTNHNHTIFFSGALLLFWLIGMIFLMEPSPLKTPDWLVGALQSMLNLSEPNARIFATIVLRGLGIGMIGVLLAGVLRAYPLIWSGPIMILLTPILAIGVKWIQYGYFPLRIQIFFIVTVALIGALLGLSLRRSGIAITTLVLFVVGLMVWGLSTGISDDLDEAARATGHYLLSRAEIVGSGDEAFDQLFVLAFAFAEDNSHGRDPVFHNQAAILALGVILGDDQVARIGGRDLNPEFQQSREALRRRVTVHGRGDLPRHYWVSAALTVLSGEDRALAIGIAKEVADSLPGGSGFSFVDMAANQAGIRLAVVATQDIQSARSLQLRLIDPGKEYQFFPEIDGLPENISNEDFQNEYGGLGGAKSREILAEIERRINACNGLR